ncbi:MAG: hypothetical protein WD512_11540 [Candidatus Paceibacterota bacterium]
MTYISSIKLINLIIMKHLIQYSSNISQSFWHYLNGAMTAEGLIRSLRNIQAIHRDETNTKKDLCFKFSKDDTLVTTINDLEKDLHRINDREFTQERMRESISLQGELFIYYA